MTCECYYQSIKTEEEGISNLYVDALVEKLVIDIEGHRRSIKLLHLRGKISYIVNFSKEHEKERTLL